MNTYILNTDNYIFESFSDGGFSGKILLAIPNVAGLPKLLVKSENPSSACNEFMYSRLAELLNIAAPKAYIMDVSKKDKKLFSSPYVVGIEYIEGLHHFTLEDMRTSPELRKEYANQYALAAMFDQSDRVQLAMTADNHIIGFDFTETFWLSDMTLGYYQLDDDPLTDIMRGRLQASMRQGFSMLSAGASVVKKHIDEMETTADSPDYLEPMRRILQLTEEQIEELTDVLFEVYPASVPVYFEEYIKVLKNKVIAYFKSIGKDITQGE